MNSYFPIHFSSSYKKISFKAPHFYYSALLFSKLILIFILFLSLVFLCQLKVVHAGFDKGNGGDGFDCTEPKDSFFLAEEIEAPPMWGIKTLTQHQLAEEIDPLLIIQKLFELSPNFTEVVKEDFLWVKSKLKIIDNVDLVDLDDDLLAWIPKKCTLVQLALQTQTDVFVVQSYWNKMNPLQQTMLLSHEAIYRSLDRLAVKQKFKLQNSIGVRLLNAFIWQQGLSKSYTPMSPTELKQALSMLRLPKLN